MRNVSSKNKELFILGISSILITLFLFFIDEGNYDFNWVAEPFVWIIFLIYAVPIFLGQLLVSKVMLKNISQTNKMLLSILIGSVIGITCTIGILFSGFLN
ncbi:hypothetical protein [Aquimarina sp. 2201CG14-23]|uniref:hypothetical protein n=1 Tax=Aquimarina mycalae TaxID=3040073 RepID=UPI002477E1E7|nr:hypothetical protein [Aquimarina sp. 2201CG14-23]MDH7445945.1 hypothetical protein [Aquimarina sp. 2201CG14-23]